MMKRFSRRRRSGGEGKKRSIDANDWLQKIVEGRIVDTTSLEPWTDHGVPTSIAAIGRGIHADGTDLIVAFSPKSATEALLGGLSAAEYAVENAKFSGQVVIVAPQWESGPRRLLALLGHRSYHLEPIAAPTLGTSRNLIHPDTRERVLATGATQLAARLPEAESRAAFRRAAIALEGLAAKHGGAVRVGRDRLELVVLARRVAEIRV